MRLAPILPYITIYRYKCNRVECVEKYIGESARTFAEVQGTSEGSFPNI